MVKYLTEYAERFGGEIQLAGCANPELRGVELDSRRIQAQGLFAALSGGTESGVKFVRDAVSRGACAVLTTPDEARTLKALSEFNLPLWIHSSAREVVGFTAAALHGEATKALQVVGVTGTNGKTSVAHLAAQLFEAGGLSTAEFGTTGYRLSGGRSYPATHTTPDASTLQRMFAEHRELGGRAAILEASSHALDQGRLAGTEINLAIFTNLTRDHLDYHVDMERYAQAKQKLFAMLSKGGTAIVNAGDPFAERMGQVASDAGANVLFYLVKDGNENKSAGAVADLSASDLCVDRAGTRFQLEGMGIPKTELRVALFGRHNVQNVLAATAAALLSGVSVSDLRDALPELTPAPGRLEEVAPGAREFNVMVDYAHTENALESVLNSAREVLNARGRGRLLCVFGCGGDRDKGKREGMGSVVGRLADVAIVTSDNPRSEAPEQIASEIRTGLCRAESMTSAKPELHTQLDRRLAIELAIELARSDDVVLIAGKGHETTQEINGVKLPFDDRNVVMEILA
ncbi:MAG: UDP-N-acetylmuramoyl-L-alanyl-D-glutamate--2,6-diaminopimelate ligase [Planctomycetota bacterium]